MKLGDRLADRITAALGTWRFLIIQSSLLAIWVAINASALMGVQWDGYPFILLNLALSFQAAYAAPVIMMATRRVEAHDRAASANFQEQTEEVLRRIDSVAGKIDEVLTNVHQQVISIYERLEVEESPDDA